MKTCILVANASQGEFYLCKNLRTSPLETVQKLNHNESRKRKSELISDRWGGGNAKLGARSGCEKIDPKAVEAENFARHLIQEIRKIKNDNPDCRHLIICSSPHFEGLLRIHASHSTTSKERLEFEEITYITKDYTGMTSEKLQSVLKENLSL